jgi:hypothetical protein
MPPVTAVMRRVRRDVEAALSPDSCLRTTAGKYRKAFSNLREVIMSMSEYEERFRPPAPSLHPLATHGSCTHARASAR